MHRSSFCPVKEHCLPVSSKNISKSTSQFEYIDIGAVDAERKEIVAPRRIKGQDAPSRARQVLRSQDVLVSTVRPNLNAVAYVPAHLDGAIGSTGFCVLRANASELDSRFLFHWVKSPGFVSRMVNLATGASYPAVTDAIVKSSLIPLPSIDEQRRVAGVLDRVEALRAQRTTALTLLESLPQSFFEELFGDPRSNPTGWPIVQLDQVTLLITDGEHQTPKREADGIKLLSARNVKDGRLDFSDVDFVSDDEYRRISKRCNPVRGDLLLSCSGTIGRAAIVEIDEPLCLVRSAALIRPNTDLVLPQFLLAVLRAPHLKATMRQRANASSQANLFQNQIKSLLIPLPPIGRQLEFVERMRTFSSVKAGYESVLTKAQTMSGSLTNEFFCSESVDRGVKHV